MAIARRPSYRLCGNPGGVIRTILPSTSSQPSVSGIMANCSAVISCSAITSNIAPSSALAAKRRSSSYGARGDTGAFARHPSLVPLWPLLAALVLYHSKSSMRDLGLRGLLGLLGAGDSGLAAVEPAGAWLSILGGAAVLGTPG